MKAFMRRTRRLMLPWACHEAPRRCSSGLERLAALGGAVGGRLGLGEALPLAGILPLAGVARALAGALALAGVRTTAFHTVGKSGGGESADREDRSGRDDQGAFVHKDH